MDTWSFAGVPHSADGTAGGERSDAAVVGVPLARDGIPEPTADGPDAIRRAARLAPSAYDPGTGTEIRDRLRIVDAGNVAPGPGGAEAVAGRLGPVRGNTGMLAVLGGSPAASLPAVAAAAVQPHTLVRLSASAAMAADGDPAASAVRRMIERGHLTRVFQLGLRGFGATRADLEWAASTGAEYWTMADLAELGPAPFLDRIVAVTSGPAYLSIDLDVLDPVHAPAVAEPEPGGLTGRELLGIVRMLARHLDLAGVDVVGLVPGRDTGDGTARVAARALTEVLAGRAAGVAPTAASSPA